MLRRIDVPNQWAKASPCMCPEHNPPQWMVLEPGTYEWTCPWCGNKQYFTIMSVTCGGVSSGSRIR